MRVHQSSPVERVVSISHAMDTRQGCWVRPQPDLSAAAVAADGSWTDLPLDGEFASSEDLIERRNGVGAPPAGPDRVPYAEALAIAGNGRFQLFLALTCGTTFLATALQNNLNAFILTSVHCDLKIDSLQMGLLNALFLAGGICSNFMWGAVADLFGRRTVLFYGILVDGMITAVSSLSQNFLTLAVFRFLNGFVVGGPASLVFAYMGDFFTDKIRPRVICYVGIFWTLSWVIMPGIAWIVIPLTFTVRPLGLVFNSWRLLVALTAVPSLLSAVLLTFFPESPKFSLSRGAASDARDTLATIYEFNSGNHHEHYPVRSLEPVAAAGPSAGDPKSACRPLAVLVHQVALLAEPNTYRATILTCSLFFANMFGYYGLGLWLPDLFGRMSAAQMAEPGASLTLCAAPTAAQNSTDVFCDPSEVDTKVFTQSLVMGVIGLTGNVASGLLAGQLRRATLPVILTGSAAVCVVIIHWSTSMTLNLVLASAFQLTVGTANLVYNSLIVDMFPPHVSGMGVCVAILSGRVGSMVSNLVFGNLLDVYCSVPILLVAAVLFGGTIASCFIPNEPYSEDIVNSNDNKDNEEFMTKI